MFYDLLRRVVIHQAIKGATASPTGFNKPRIGVCREQMPLAGCKARPMTFSTARQKTMLTPTNVSITNTYDKSEPSVDPQLSRPVAWSIGFYTPNVFQCDELHQSDRKTCRSTVFDSIESQGRMKFFVGRGRLTNSHTTAQAICLR